jgi:hypothetical protein
LLYSILFITSNVVFHHLILHYVCSFQGKSMTLGTFSRIAGNVQSMWFKDDPAPEMVEVCERLWHILR